MRRIALLAALSVVGCRTATQTPGGQTAVAEAAAEPLVAPQSVASEVVASMDDQVDPCVDFYAYACGGWLAATELPPDQPRFGRFHTLRQRNLQTLRSLLEGASADEGPDAAKLATMYGACMDVEAVEAADLQPLQPLLEHVDAVTDMRTLADAVGRLHAAGVKAVFSLDVNGGYKKPDLNVAHLGQGGLGLPDRDYYLKEDASSVQMREDYTDHVAEILELGGAEPDRAEARAESIVAFERRLAEVAMARDALRDPQKRYFPADVAGLKKVASGFAWPRYLRAVGRADLDDFNLSPSSYFDAMPEVLSSTDVEVLRAYLRWHVLRAYAQHLSEPFVQAHFSFYGQRLRGQKALEPRWKRCVKATDENLGELLGKRYVETAFSESAKETAVEMIHFIELAFEKGLPELEWMDDATAARAREKMEAVVNKVGYPEVWRDYEGLEVTETHAANVLRAQRFAFERELAEVGKPLDDRRWHMTPPTVNAYYNPLNNEMVFPAGILQPPFFDPDFPMAMNFGGIGMVMGHELTHGFDDQGRKFDAAGRLTEWWDEGVAKRFEQRAMCVEELYDGYEVQPGVFLNGKLTLGENIADFGGIKQAHRAYLAWAAEHDEALDEPVVPGLSHEQLFFVSFAQLWCTKSSPEIERVLAVTDPHSHPRYRVNGPLSNLPAFWDAFSCRADAPMRPSNTCEVW